MPFLAFDHASRNLVVKIILLLFIKKNVQSKFILREPFYIKKKKNKSVGSSLCINRPFLSSHTGKWYIMGIPVQTAIFASLV